jgi:hypothetical protein
MTWAVAIFGGVVMVCSSGTAGLVVGAVLVLAGLAAEVVTR